MALFLLNATLGKEVIQEVVLEEKPHRSKKALSKHRFYEEAGKSEVLQNLYNYKAAPRKCIQKKVNYYMTPYVHDLTFKKYMDFSTEITSSNKYEEIEKNK